MLKLILRSEDKIMRRGGYMQDVFISYSSRNREVAEKICMVLEQEGVKCWIAPRNITAGKEWGEEIIKGIETSKVLLLVFSEASNESIQVLREVERAVSKRLSIVNFRIQNIEPTKSMEYFLYTNHWIEAYEGNIDEHIKGLGEILKPVLDAYKEVEYEVGARVHGGTYNSLNESHVKKNKYKKYLAVIGGVSIMGALIGAVVSWSVSRMNLKEMNQDSIVVVKDGTGSQDNMEISSEENREKEKIQTNSNQTTVQDAKNDVEEILQPEKEEGATGELEIVTNTNIPSKKNEEKVPVEVNVAKSDEKDYRPQISQSQSLALEVGEYVRFGTYQGAPIDWIVIGIGEDGRPLLISKHVLTLKSFDAAESGAYNRSNNGEKFDVKKTQEQVYADYAPETLREMKGSNHWGSSNLRTWLNSDERKVVYNDSAPTKEAVGGRTNDYYKEAGFLSEFTEEEKKRIQYTTYKSVLSEVDIQKKVGGSSLFTFQKTNIKESKYNIDKAYYEELTDKVFLLSVEELIKYMEEEYIEIKTTVTEEAIANDKSGWYEITKAQRQGYHMWWLRTPVGQSPSEMCAVGNEGTVVYNEYTTSPGVGVRPAMYIDVNNIEVDGDGTKNLPYIIK